MILIELRGGLGNQLFIIFACLNYALKYDIKYKIVQNNYTLKNCLESNRFTYWDSMLKNIGKFALPVGDCYGKFKNLLSEKNFYYNELPFVQGRTYIKGYYQSYKYFTEYYDKITQILEINLQKEDIKKKYKFDYEHTCSIHFRFGDYKKNPDYYFLLNENYYIKAVNYIIENTAKKTFLIFFEKEDELRVREIIEEVKKCKNFREAIFIDTSIKDYKQMLIMSNCHSNIIANSSFSYWGAMFNTNPKKVVVYPNKWFGPAANLKTKDMCPENWIRI